MSNGLAHIIMWVRTTLCIKWLSWLQSEEGKLSENGLAGLVYFILKKGRCNLFSSFLFQETSVSYISYKIHSDKLKSLTLSGLPSQEGWDELEVAGLFTISSGRI